MEILNDIDSNHSNLSNIEAIKTLLQIEVGFSFFPKDGIFDQLISTGTFELIKNDELKRVLLEMFNHQKERNYATSNEIDLFNKGFRGSFCISFHFFPSIPYKNKLGSIVGDEFIAIISPV